MKVDEKAQDYTTENFAHAKHNYVISERRNAKIIAKAKNNLFFTNIRRHHHVHDNWIADEPDGLGFKIS